MIKFFRHIRRSLINQNKMKNYFKYAFGEVLLVVIGILIALAINNWNENRKAKNNEIVLLSKLQEENSLNMASIEDHLELRKEMPDAVESFIKLLESKNLESKSELTQEKLGNILRSAAYTFIQSNLVNYINTYNAKNSELSKELATLEFYQNDLHLSSTKGLDLKIKYVFEALNNDVDFSSLNIISYKTLESLRFKNNLVIIADIEYEISSMFIQTYNQMQKVDSLITQKLK
ncbi:DUF6090 family protein [Winogradskyella algicola]|uniref:DUF6090 family protein n=1 Tax=Winogradskyella algicola TaxID=2575815 RepID=UPI001107D09B|nr:DUF6090 family protein [Winogradskyella algicola]